LSTAVLVEVLEAVVLEAVDLAEVEVDLAEVGLADLVDLAAAAWAAVLD
jgi:hypothetical protein